MHVPSVAEHLDRCAKAYRLTCAAIATTTAGIGLFVVAVAAHAALSGPIAAGFGWAGVTSIFVGAGFFVVAQSRMPDTLKTPRAIAARRRRPSPTPRRGELVLVPFGTGDRGRDVIDAPRVS